MNYHFLSFVLDILVWLSYSALLARFVSSTEAYSKEKSYRISGIFLLSALITGCGAVITHGLPDVGISWFSFFVVFICTSTSALYLSPALRLKFKEHFSDAVYRYINPFIKRVKITAGMNYGTSQ